MHTMFLKLVSLAVFAFSLLSVNLHVNIEGVFAQTNEDITITVANSSFAPMTNVHGSQARVSVTYQVNDESLENEKINGIMKIYTSNGTLLHSSSFPEGFVAKKKGGTEDFKTTMRDPTIKSLIANVTLTDFDRKNILSNTVTANLSLQESETAVAAAAATQQEENGEAIGAPDLESQDESSQEERQSEGEDDENNED